MILGTQESLILPFNFGTFQEVRWGGFFSVVSGGAGNFYTPIAGWTGNTSGPFTQFFMGFKDTGISIPGGGKSSFVGISKRSTDTQNILGPGTLGFGGNANTAQNGNYQTIDTTGNIIFPINNASIPAQNSMSLTPATGDTSFASFWGITLGIQGNLYSGMAIYDTAFYTDVSTGNLSRLVNTPPLISSFATGYYTTGGLNSTNILQFPQAIYIYFPFFNNQLRIHNIDIEQFN